MKILRVNDFAPNDGFSVFCNGVGKLKSDGFAVVAGNTVLTVDGGCEGDRGINKLLKSDGETVTALGLQSL